MTGVLVRRGKSESRDEIHVKNEAGVGAMHLGTKEHPGLLVTTRFFPGTLRGTTVLSKL